MSSVLTRAESSPRYRSCPVKAHAWGTWGAGVAAKGGCSSSRAEKQALPVGSRTKHGPGATDCAWPDVAWRGYAARSNEPVVVDPTVACGTSPSRLRLTSLSVVPWPAAYDPSESETHGHLPRPNVSNEARSIAGDNTRHRARFGSYRCARRPTRTCGQEVEAESHFGSRPRRSQKTNARGVAKSLECSTGGGDLKLRLSNH